MSVKSSGIEPFEPVSCRVGSIVDENRWFTELLLDEVQNPFRAIWQREVRFDESGQYPSSPQLVRQLLSAGSARLIRAH